MKRLVLPALAALSLSACATEPTRFAPAAGPRAVGFSEMRVEPGRYRVSFNGGPGAPPAQVEDYALLRAANLAISDGYDWFRVTERVTRQTGYAGSSLSIGIGGMNFGRRSAVGGGVSTGVPLGGGPSLSTTLEILMGRGAKPPEGDIYDARGVQRTIGPRA